MDLSLDPPAVPNYIRSVSADGIRIGEQTHALPALVSGDEIVTDWPAVSVDELGIAHLEPIFGMAPELVLLGTGTSQVFPDPRLVYEIQKNGIGIEIMNTPAACRTYNVLASEGRKVIAALMPLT